MQIRGLSILLAVAATTFVAACSDQGTTSEVGSLRMPLRGSAPSGNTYQLSGALFDVTSAGVPVLTLDSDVDPAATVLSADLPIGTYEINLNPMWAMLNVGTGNPVSATLLSPASQTFDVTAETTTTVAYQFRINGEILVIGGTLEVVLDITETNTCVGDPRAAALAACTAQFGANCYDTGSASIIGYADSSSPSANCDIGEGLWEQFCYADGPDLFNCNTCQVGAIKLAHAPCECGDNTATVGSFCDATASGVTFSQAFEELVTPGPQCTAWNTFRSTIDPMATYNSVTLRNTDGASAVCTGVEANTLCQALNTGVAVDALPCGGLSWAVGDCGAGLELSATGNICNCDVGFVARPCIGNENWGGAGTPTCGGPSQTLEVICE